jgi:hypothetical protein
MASPGKGTVSLQLMPHTRGSLCSVIPDTGFGAFESRL